MELHAKTLLKQAFIFSSLCVLTFTSPTAVYALSEEQRRLYNKNIFYFDLEASCASTASIAANGEISPNVGKGMSANAQKKFQEILVAAGKKFKINPNFVAAFYYIENSRTGDSTNNADTAAGTPATGNGKWREPAPPYGKGQPYGTSSAAASGPFQFIPSTWAAYGADGNGDGKKDVSNFADGVFGAAKYLAALGAKEGASDAELKKAAFGYNHSNTYAQSALNVYKYLTKGEQTSVSSEGGGGCSESTDAFTLDGYAWPVVISKKDVDSGYPWPCEGSCHHDRTPSFDLATKATVKNGDDSSSVGKDVVAINDGTVSNIKIYNGIGGCYAFQLTGKDGFMYWHGHVRKPAVKEGDKVKAGDKLAEIGERKCTGNGSYPHLHIDRGSPKGKPGGSVCCRDKGLVDIMNKLYKNLP